MFILTIIIFILILSLLILVHEYGHFIMARRSHIHVEEFGFGFPPQLWSKRKHNTIFSINAIPLGGFVKLLGEDEDVEQENSFSRRSPWVKFKVIITGVLLNFLLAWLLLTIWFWLVPPEVPNKVVIAGVEKNSVAETVNIRVNDIILEADNQEIKNSEEFSQFTKNHQGQEVSFLIFRYNQKITKKVQLPENKDVPLGIAMADIGGKFPQVKWYYAPLAALVEIAQVIWLSLSFVWQLILSLFGQAQISSEAVSGPIGIFAFLYQTISFGWLYVLRFVALLSLALGFFNILPFPALDGGRLIFIAGEAIYGKKLVKAEFENIVHWIGFLILLILVGIVTYNDIVKLVLK